MLHSILAVHTHRHVMTALPSWNSYFTQKTQLTSFHCIEIMIIFLSLILLLPRFTCHPLTLCSAMPLSMVGVGGCSTDMWKYISLSMR